MNWQFLWETFWLSLQGVPVTLAIAVIAILIGTPFALVLAVAKIRELPVLTPLINLYITATRSTPLILQILIMYSLVPSLINRVAQAQNWSLDVFAINPIYYAYIVFTLSAIAALTEIYRAALLTVDRGQIEAALASGLSELQAFRRIVFPQAIGTAIPNLSNLTISLIKGTSLVFVMTVRDITAIARIEAAYGYNYIEAYLDIFIVYILICSIIQLAFNLLERYFNRHKSTHTAGNLEVTT